MADYQKILNAYENLNNARARLHIAEADLSESSQLAMQAQAHYTAMQAQFVSEQNKLNDELTKEYTVFLREAVQD